MTQTRDTCAWERIEARVRGREDEGTGSPSQGCRVEMRAPSKAEAQPGTPVMEMTWDPGGRGGKQLMGRCTSED